ncbi:endonuclease/exonuclease/phosphatase family protein [Micromonospora sp. WMMA1923]|uniref:endonuclease/exonuclease/phosphatase family protein n=1 Tax=Micromonospora sp. WMMA1923 TaxID=3404125 RepID=UPI003B939085
MADRAYRTPRWRLAGYLLSVTALLAACSANDPTGQAAPTGQPGPTGQPAPTGQAAPTGPAAPDRPAGVTQLRVLQANLCNSGQAGCYTGRSVARTAEVIRAETPDVVTLNEACRDDLDALRPAMEQAPGTVIPAFRAARNARTGDAYRCVNGQQYGVGLLVRLPTANPEHTANPGDTADPEHTANPGHTADPGATADPGHTVHSGIYPAQDPADPEQRAWLCLDAPTVVYACTTHLAYTSSSLALAQCGHLLGVEIPQRRADAREQPTVVSGDLNLRHGGTPDVRSCVPTDYLHVHDGAVQQLMASGRVTIDSSRSVDMAGTTDHAGFLVTLTVTR